METPMGVQGNSLCLNLIILMLTYVHSHTLMAPRGYMLAGIAGTCGAWIDGFQIIITR